jgi:hypothetical protein
MFLIQKKSAWNLPNELHKLYQFQEFQKAYIEFIGQTIPFRECGFSDLISFLGSISDTVELEKMQIGEFRVVAKVDQKVQHVAKLVAGQNTKVSRYAEKIYSPILYLSSNKDVWNPYP